MNFRVLLEEEINKIKNNKVKPKLLLHACCAPCSSYVIEYLSNYFDITIYYLSYLSKKLYLEPSALFNSISASILTFLLLLNIFVSI